MGVSIIHFSDIHIKSKNDSIIKKKDELIITLVVIRAFCSWLDEDVLLAIFDESIY